MQVSPCATDPYYRDLPCTRSESTPQEHHQTGTACTVVLNRVETRDTTRWRAEGSFETKPGRRAEGQKAIRFRTLRSVTVQGRRSFSSRVHPRARTSHNTYMQAHVHTSYPRPCARCRYRSFDRSTAHHPHPGPNPSVSLLQEMQASLLICFISNKPPKNGGLRGAGRQSNEKQSKASPSIQQRRRSFASWLGRQSVVDSLPGGHPPARSLASASASA